ncbi:MAG: MFS transporter [Ferrimicrobium sp.]
MLVLERPLTEPGPVNTPFLREIRDPDGSITQGHGPFTDYSRTIALDSTGREIETIRASLSAPGLGWLFIRVYRRLLVNPQSRILRLLPPAPLSANSVGLIARAFWVATVIAYCGTLLGQTLAYAAPTLHAGPLAQATVLGGARVDVLLALPIARIADRRSRVTILYISLLGCVVATALCALSPTIWALGIGQVLAKAGTTTALLVLTVIVAETMEDTARAWALGFLIIAAALGTGLCAILVATLSLSPLMWRVLFGIALVGIPLVRVAKRLPEPPRFTQHSRPIPMRTLAQKKHRRRLLLITMAALMINIFFIPQSQFRNQYLRFDQHFSAWQVSLFTIGTNLPGGVGLAIGARQAEVRGRRGIATLGLIGGSLLLGGAFLSSGAVLVALAGFGTIAGTSASPALSVFGPELFPTRLRSSANSIATVASRIGSVTGIFFVGYLAAHGWGFGTPIALLAIFPLLLAIIVWRYFPETRGESLENINPEDRQ